MSRLLILVTLLFSVTSYGVIDTRNGNYSNTFVDIIVPGSGYDLRVARTYNSRSLYNGLFGFGWCSDFETRLEITSEGNPLITECGAGQKISYSPKGVTSQSTKEVVDKIVAEVRKRRGKSLNDDYYKKFEADLYENVDLRTTYAQRLNIAKNIKADVTYYANGSEVEEITFNSKHYTRKLADGTSQRFSPEGRLTHIYDKNMNYLVISYKGNLISEVVDNAGRKLTFMYDKNQKLNRIVGPNNLAATYKFDDAVTDNLANVKNGWGNTYIYEYDNLHNLTKIQYPDKTSVSLSYNKQRDWVTGFTDREGCKEGYTYETSKTSPQNHYWTTVTKTCKGETVVKNRYEFWYKPKADKSVYLHRVLTKIDNQETDIIYHPEFGKPVSIRRNSERISFEYYENGLVRARSTPTERMEFSYNPTHNKVERVVHSIINSEGKVASVRTSHFSYDERGNMESARNSLGQQVKLAYDARGRLRQITDQANKVVTIQYEERFGRPHIVTRAGMGTIKMNYNSRGEVEGFESKEGPQVATQVGATLNSLLDIIAPASAELFL